MNYGKQPIDIDEQLALLQNRGLVIEDIFKAIQDIEISRNRRFALKPQQPNRLPLNWIAPTQKPIKLYHQLCSLLYLEQSITPCMDLKSSLLKLFVKYSNVDLHAMGFPKGCQEETLWR